MIASAFRHPPSQYYYGLVIDYINIISLPKRSVWWVGESGCIPIGKLGREKEEGERERRESHVEPRWTTPVVITTTTSSGSSSSITTAVILPIMAHGRTHGLRRTAHLAGHEPSRWIGTH